MSAPATLPASRVPFVNPKTGVPTTYFYQFLASLLTNTGGGTITLNDVLAAVAMIDDSPGGTPGAAQSVFAAEMFGSPAGAVPATQSQAALLAAMMSDAPALNPTYYSVTLSGGKVATFSGDLLLAPASGVVRLSTTTYVAGVTTATGTISIKDSTGTVYKLLAHT